MFENITLGEIATFIIVLGSVVTAIVLLTKPIRNTINRLTKLERAVFDDKGEVKFASKKDIGDFSKDTVEIKAAVNIICDAMMAMLDSQINGDNEEELRAVRAKLQERRGIV